MTLTAAPTSPTVGRRAAKKPGSATDPPQPGASIHRCGYKLGGFYRNGESAIWVNVDRRVAGLLVQTVTHEYIHYQRWRDGIRCSHRPCEDSDPCEDEVDDLAWDIAPMDLVPSCG